MGQCPEQALQQGSGTLSCLTGILGSERFFFLMPEAYITLEPKYTWTRQIWILLPPLNPVSPPPDMGWMMGWALGEKVGFLNSGPMGQGQASMYVPWLLTLFILGAPIGGELLSPFPWKSWA